ncbi:MAG: porin family protein [Bacteroidales bacterium]|nr:porin family protein [Bacteroidales bacterium]
MKKVLATVAAICALATVSNAQFWVGGNVGFESSTDSKKNSDYSVKTDAESQFTFSPKVGYDFNEKMCVGLGLSIGTSGDKDFDGTKDNNVVGKTTQTNFGIAPFFRYYFAEFGDFKVYGEAALGVNFGSGKIESTPVGGSTTILKSGSTAIGLNVHPAIQYNLSDKISLHAGINIFNLGFNMQTYTPDKNASENKTRSTDFEIGVRDNVFVSGAISVGLAIHL